MSTEFINPKTKEPNTTAVKLSFIGMMIDMIDRLFKSHEDMESSLRGELKNHIVNSIGAPLLNVQESMFDLAITSLLDAIVAKSEALNIMPYGDNGDAVGCESKEQALKNTNIILNEVAKDLCDSVKVIDFMPFYDDTQKDIDTRYALESFESLVEIRVCGKEYIASMFDGYFYTGYYAVPDVYHKHTLIGREDEDCDIEHDYLPKIDESASNPLVLKALENLCLHEADKCIDVFLYKKALHNNSLVAVADKLSALIGVKQPVCLLACAKLQRLTALGGIRLDEMTMLLKRQFKPAFDENNPESAMLTALMIVIATTAKFSCNFSVAPFEQYIEGQ